jgi:excinuclease ABC subunit C
MLQDEVEEKELLEQWMTKRRGYKVFIRVPQKGEKEKLVELACKNAQLVLNTDKERLKREESRTKGATLEIASLLGLKQMKRMEAYDISNTSGFSSVGSMVVYENGKPKKNDYRKFKIKSVDGPDDYASLEEVLTRRFSHKKEAEDGFSAYPDLILMDGGRGQVNVALAVLEHLNLEIPVCGMVKDDNHRTRGLYFNNKEIPIERNSEAFKLITRIQDEAHRFAIEFHRNLRSKEQVHSVLDDIRGIGPTRRKAIMKHFVSIEALKQADIEELKKVPSMNEKSAIEVYNFFHK